MGKQTTHTPNVFLIFNSKYSSYKRKIGYELQKEGGTSAQGFFASQKR
jgi:hypothetical protein